MTDDTITAAVIADLQARAALGLTKYGVTLDRTDLSRKDWLQHLYEEILDAAGYLKCVMREEDAARAMIRELADELERRVDANYPRRDPEKYHYEIARHDHEMELVRRARAMLKEGK